ncbi:LysR family transcriptional regulator [Trinickia caryophylli]|nr:LysR family transcriptional regulator [Trinickia caryophylli]PMS12741.1 LysR family transcriptional regulator [Trinickia caryophylli]TRX15147.1 LysR family transcriptional regulator [Trinickia caryophylli]WQE15011.1 LysR family transcriptional regulator [Trinickia caryophylli]
MNTRFLETFVTLAELENFRATARVLHATPAAISLRIKSLEDELRTELVDRSTTQFRLTPVGESLLGLARNVVEAARALREAAGRETVVGGRLRLGVIETVVHSWLSHYITQLNAKHPQLEVDLTVDSSAVLQQRLLAGEIDLAIRVEGIASTKIVSSAIASYPVRWIARRGLTSKRTTGLASRVLQRPILTFGRGTAPQVALQSIVHTLAQQEGLHPDQARVTCSPSVAAIVQLVRDGYGVACIPSLFVTEELATGEFVELPLKPVPPPIVVSLCKPANASAMINAAANAAHLACSAYCRSMKRELVEAL